MEHTHTNRAQFPEVVVVEASAGSGKTYALAKRYLGLLIHPALRTDRVLLRNILAITFTNKATVEMKERILEFLKRIALDAFEHLQQEEEIISALGIDKQSARKIANDTMETLIANYTFFQVQTIDSFINALLLGCAFTIDRSARFKIKQDYTQYVAYCLDTVIDLAANDPNILKLLEEFLEHYLFVENKNSWFPKKDILSSIQSLFKLRNKYGGVLRYYQYKSQDIIKQKAIIFDAIRQLSVDMPEDLNGTVKKSIIRFVENDKHIFELKSIPDSFRYEDVPMKKGKSASSVFAQQWKRIHEATCVLVELDAMAAYSPYIMLFEKIVECFNVICKYDDILFLGELNSKARLLFSEQGLTIAELYYRMATRFNHYLIDEFQDTSTLQWRNLEEMVREAIATGGSLFYVGDKKQAIYRFRGGEAELFDKVQEEFRDYVKFYSLKKNWRSHKAIISFNNEIFSGENLQRSIMAMDIDDGIIRQELLESIRHVFADAHQCDSPDKPFGYVSIERLEENNKQERNHIMKEKILALLTQLHERFSYKDIAILCRDNDEVELVTAWLLEVGVPVESEKTLSIEENALIQELISFLRFLYSPIDDLSFASFILGDIFTTAAGMSRQDMTDFIFYLRRQRQRETDTSLYRKLRENHPQVWEAYIDEFFKGVGFISPYELVVSIYQRYRIMERFKDHQAFFMKFLELLKQQEDDCIGLGEVLAYFDNAPKEDLYICVDETDSVHVLTIHKSKGLEFGVVVTPFLRIDIEAETGEIPGSYVTQEDAAYSLVRITKEHRKYSENLRSIYKDAYIKACLDAFNGLYVALTRSKFELYIFIPKKSKNAPNKARCLIPETVVEYGQKVSYDLKKAKDRYAPVMPPSDYHDWLLGMQDEFREVSSLKYRHKVIEGTILHYALACIADVSTQNISTAIQEALLAVRAQYPCIKDDAFLIQRITGLLDKETIKPFFYLSNAKLYREKEIVTAQGITKRIDRLIVKENQVWVVDYKSSRDGLLEHQKQLQEYMGVVRDMYPGKKTEGFLIYLDDGSIEAIHG